MQKVAIITGGSQGIGAGLVAGYRRQGWAVVANARTITPSQDPEVAAVDGDVSEQPTAERIVGAALGRFGRVDTLVNNAGVFISKPFTDYTADDYAVMVRVNLTGFFWLTQRVIAEMLSQGGGHVVNISAAVADYQVASAPSVLTALTKGGLAAATRSLAVEYASRGIRVNAVSPGVIQTPMHPGSRAPCQCPSQAGETAVSPGCMVRTWPSRVRTTPKPSVTCKAWSRAWECEAVRAPGENRTAPILGVDPTPSRTITSAADPVVSGV